MGFRWLQSFFFTMLNITCDCVMRHSCLACKHWRINWFVTDFKEIRLHQQESSTLLPPSHPTKPWRRLSSYCCFLSFFLLLCKSMYVCACMYVCMYVCVCLLCLYVYASLYVCTYLYASLIACSLTGNQLGVAGATALAESIKRNSTLTTLMYVYHVVRCLSILLAVLACT